MAHDPHRDVRHICDGQGQRGNLWLSQVTVPVGSITIHRRLLWFAVPLQALQVLPLFVVARIAGKWTGMLASRTTVGALLPLFVVVAAAAIVAGLAQTRGMVSFKAIAPKWSNINPASGLKRMLGTDAVVALLRALLKVGGIGLLAWSVLSAARPELLALAGVGPSGVAQVLHAYALKLAWMVGAAFFLIAVIDWVWRWVQLEKKLRMSRQEIVQENRESEGDPMVKARQQSIARARARQRMLQNVKKADVVVVNPTHVAVALKYDLDEGPAPMVLAMGERLLAQRIKELARKHDVPIVENTPVARALLASAQVGRPIPPALYAAIAEILAFVYRQRGRLPGGGRLTLDGGRS